jgi:hypothetical protein
VIKQVLTHDYLATRAGWLATQPTDERRDPADLPDGEPPTAEELAQVRDALALIAQAPPDPELDAEFPPPEGPNGDPLPSLAQEAYIAREDFTSVVQSVLEAYFETRDPSWIEVSTPPEADSLVGGAPQLPDPVTGERLSLAENDQLFGATEITDPLWVTSAIAMGWRKLRGRHPFNAARPHPRPLARDARLVILGDWGSGIPRAQNVAKEIRRIIEPDIGRREQHVIHLGDVYYSGFKREYDRNFLRYWPVQQGEPVGSWSCNGNHDMYSGGHAYFGHLLADSRFRAQDRSSWFALENDDWQLLGLDTAYEDHALIDPQGAWVADKLREHKDRRTMLLSHHQLFSAYGSQGPKIRDKLRGPLDSGRITAWFWGHEHRCVQYEDGTQGVGKARLVGHSGVPVYAHREPVRPPAEFHYLESFPTALEEWAVMGFAVVELSGAHAEVRYFNEFGHELDKMAEVLAD